MSYDYRAEIFVIANTREKIVGMIDILQKQSLFPASRLHPVKIECAPGKRPDSQWYYAGSSFDCECIPSEDKTLWRSAFNECASFVGKDGTVIAEVTDSNLASERGNEIQEWETIASKPKGGMMDYDTNPIHDYMEDDDLDYLGIPRGFDKFKAAFIRAYGVAGKEMIDIYKKK